MNFNWTPVRSLLGCCLVHTIPSHDKTNKEHEFIQKNSCYWFIGWAVVEWRKEEQKQHWCSQITDLKTEWKVTFNHLLTALIIALELVDWWSAVDVWKHLLSVKLLLFPPNTRRQKNCLSRCNDDKAMLVALKICFKSSGTYHFFMAREFKYHAAMEIEKKIVTSGKALMIDSFKTNLCQFWNTYRAPHHLCAKSVHNCVFLKWF